MADEPRCPTCGSPDPALVPGCSDSDHPDYTVDTPTQADAPYPVPEIAQAEDGPADSKEERWIEEARQAIATTQPPRKEGTIQRQRRYARAVVEEVLVPALAASEERERAASKEILARGVSITKRVVERDDAIKALRELVEAVVAHPVNSGPNRDSAEHWDRRLHLATDKASALLDTVPGEKVADLWSDPNCICRGTGVTCTLGPDLKPNSPHPCPDCCVPRAQVERLMKALHWYADWEDNITSGVHDHGTEDGRSVPDMGRRAHDALMGIDVTADGYDESIEASQLARWGDNPTEEPHQPYGFEES